MVAQRATHLLAGLEDRLPTLVELYRDLHRHPELSMQEHRTAGIVAQHLRDSGYEVTEGIGKICVVGLLRNGAGPCYDAPITADVIANADTIDVITL